MFTYCFEFVGVIVVIAISLRLDWVLDCLFGFVLFGFVVVCLLML